jgi:erythrocyte band 7 integral membrane protein
MRILDLRFLFLLSHCRRLQVVQEYERAVVFRLGRLRSGGAKGPGEHPQMSKTSIEI